MDLHLHLHCLKEHLDLFRISLLYFLVFSLIILALLLSFSLFSLVCLVLDQSIIISIDVLVLTFPTPSSTTQYPKSILKYQKPTTYYQENIFQLNQTKTILFTQKSAAINYLN